jgi:hypothetical protein
MPHRRSWNRERSQAGAPGLQPQKMSVAVSRSLATHLSVATADGGVSRVLSRVVIYLGPALPPASRGGPPHAPPIWPCSGWGLPCLRCHHRSGALLPRLFTLALLRLGLAPGASKSGMFSVALSVGLPLLGVTQHPALWSSDFPPPGIAGERPPGPLHAYDTTLGRPALQTLWLKRP